MTDRDQFACALMAALVPLMEREVRDNRRRSREFWIERGAEVAYELADALLKRRGSND